MCAEPRTLQDSGGPQLLPLFFEAKTLENLAHSGETSLGLPLDFGMCLESKHLVYGEQRDIPHSRDYVLESRDSLGKGE
jgi:hypothetical protein